MRPSFANAYANSSAEKDRVTPKAGGGIGFRLDHALRNQ
jgi:hypothetical protein